MFALCPLATPIVLLGFLLPWAWGISSRLLQQSAANAPYLGQGVARGATQDGRVMVERSDRMWSTGEGNGKPLQYSCLENPMNIMKRQNDRILKEELPRSVGTQYAIGDQWRNNSRKNEGMEPKQKQYPAGDVNDDRSKVQCCKEQYCIGTWNVRSMNQGKLEVVNQKMARLNVYILGIS